MSPVEFHRASHEFNHQDWKVMFIRKLSKEKKNNRIFYYVTHNVSNFLGYNVNTKCRIINIPVMTGCLHIAMQHQSSITQLQDYIERDGNHGLANDISNITVYLDINYQTNTRWIQPKVIDTTTSQKNENAMPIFPCNYYCGNLTPHT